MSVNRFIDIAFSQAASSETLKRVVVQCPLTQPELNTVVSNLLIDSLDFDTLKQSSPLTILRGSIVFPPNIEITISQPDQHNDELFEKIKHDLDDRKTNMDWGAEFVRAAGDEGTPDKLKSIWSFLFPHLCNDGDPLTLYQWMSQFEELINASGEQDLIDNTRLRIANKRELLIRNEEDYNTARKKVKHFSFANKCNREILAELQAEKKRILEMISPNRPFSISIDSTRILHCWNLIVSSGNRFNMLAFRLSRLIEKLAKIYFSGNRLLQENGEILRHIQDQLLTAMVEMVRYPDLDAHLITEPFDITLSDADTLNRLAQHVVNAEEAVRSNFISLEERNIIEEATALTYAEWKEQKDVAIRQILEFTTSISNQCARQLSIRKTMMADQQAVQADINNITNEQEMNAYTSAPLLVYCDLTRKATDSQRRVIVNTDEEREKIAINKNSRVILKAVCVRTFSRCMARRRANSELVAQEHVNKWIVFRAPDLKSFPDGPAVLLRLKRLPDNNNERQRVVDRFHLKLSNVWKLVFGLVKGAVEEYHATAVKNVFMRNGIAAYLVAASAYQSRFQEVYNNNVPQLKLIIALDYDRHLRRIRNEITWINPFAAVGRLLLPGTLRSRLENFDPRDPNAQVLTPEEMLAVENEVRLSCVAKSGGPFDVKNNVWGGIE